MRLVWLFLFGCMSVFAQPFSAGIKAGVPLTDSLNASQNGIFEYNAPTQRYIIGGMAEVRLPLGFGVEFDALYRNLQYSSGAIAFNSISASGSNWEFPLLLKYRFHFPVVRPYVEAGVAWDTITGLKETIDQVAASSPSELQKNTTMGFVLGGGVDIHAVFLHISPELRFTRWSSQQINAVQSTIDLLHSNLNQAEFLVGITF
jgi:opacity protein-like surface antigen